MVKSVALISKPEKPELGEIIPQLLQWLRERKYSLYLDEESGAYVPGETAIRRSEIAGHEPAFVVVLGGDGTLLSAARAVAPKGIPIVAVNLGSLGFLTEVTLEDLYPTLEAVCNGSCPQETRSMLHCEVMRDGRCVSEYDALNDAVINKTFIARLVSIDLFVEGSFVANYNADGVIIATPTGSTAYSLAAGGPVLMPSVDGFVITPVSPHALTHRPFVVRDTARIEVVCNSIEQEAFLSIDGQIGMPLSGGDRVVIRKSQHQVKLLRMHKTFFEILRTKLSWGQR